MQQCWERIIRLRTKQNDPPQNVRAYLFRTVRNIFLNSRRSKRVMVDFDDAEPTDRLVSRMDEKSRDEELLEMALRELPDLQREILVLNAWSGFSFDEIAEMFDKKPGAIHTMAWRARKDLLAIMIRLRQRDGGD
jgi:RNA polymerase sigma factor (sigma-70 family)